MFESIESSQQQSRSPSNRHLPTVRSKIPEWLTNATPDVHRALRQAGVKRLPWYEQARQTMPEVTEALRQDHVLHLANLQELGDALKELPSLEAFAEPLLVAGIKERFGLQVDVRKTWLFHARRLHVDDSFVNASRDPLVQYQKSLKAATQTLLHAALQNFESWETERSGMDLDERQKAAIYDRYPINGLSMNATELAISPPDFAMLCRELDLGGQYQKKVDAFLNPVSKPGDAPDAATFNRRGLLKRVEASAFRIQVHLARLKSDISQSLYDALLQISHNRTGVSAQGEAVTTSFLRLWDIELTGVVAIGKVRDNADVVQSIAIYIPDDPVCPLKEYESGAAFTRALRDRLLGKEYLEFFQGLIPARQRTHLLAKLDKCLRPTVWNKDRGWYEPQVDPDAKLHLREHEFAQGLLTAVSEQKASVLKDDALFHGVPTADEDQKTFDQRLHYFESLAMQALNAVGFVVPAVGAVMMAVAAAQLSAEVFEGIDSWTRGEWEQGWGYIMDVVENVALIAALAAVHASGTPVVETITVETPSFIEELEEIELLDGGSRLWKPEIAPFAHDKILPPGLKPDEFGIYHYQGKEWISVESKTYSLSRSPSGQLSIQHPTKSIAYQPPLRSNGAGAWIHAGDRPLEWEGLKLFRRLGHVADAFSDVTAQRILQVSETHETVLRKALAEQHRPPALLEDEMFRFELDQRIQQQTPGGEPGTDSQALFESQYRARSVSREANAVTITHRYPELPTIIADELVRAASPAEAEALAQGRVPLRMAEEVRIYQQQVRLARAYEGLFLESVSNADTDVLILHSLEALPGWPSQLRLEVRDRHFNGVLIDAIGPAESAMNKVLIRYVDGYEAFDQQGLALHGRDNLYAAVLHAMPDGQRAAIGFPGVWDASKLKIAIQNAPLLSRPRLRELLNMQPSSPGRTSPMRLADGRLGYPLSGRGALQGFIARETLLDLIQALGVLNADTSAQQLLAALEATGMTRQQIHQRLIQVMDERLALDASLNTWDEMSASSSQLQTQLSDRAQVRDAIWRHWSETALPEVSTSASVLRLHRMSLSDFPQALPDFFNQRVARLELVDITFNALAPNSAQLIPERSAQYLELRAFFERLAHITSLEIRRSEAPTVGDEPLVIQLSYLVAQSFPALRRLCLINQNILISLMEVQSLSRLEHLEVLDLSGNTISFVAPSNLTSLSLRYLGLDNVGLQHWPVWLDGLASSTITQLSLRNNRISEIPGELSANQTVADQPTAISLQGNPLSRLAIMRIQLNEGPGSRFQFHMDIPPQMAENIALLRQERQQLREAIASWAEASSSTRPLSEETVQRRRVIGKRLLEFWRNYSEGQTQFVLTLQDISLEDFPLRLPAFFYMRVRNLQLIRVSADAAQMNTLLSSFTQLTSLELTGQVLPLAPLPSAMRQLSWLTTLSVRDQGRLIDQEAMAFFAALPNLESLDLSGNVLGEITSSPFPQGRLRWLSLDNSGLTQWPDWVDALLPLEGLTLENNQLTELPEYILQNPRNDDAHTEIALRGNPLTPETMRRAHVSERYHASYSFAMDLPDDIRQLSPEPHDSDSDFDEYESDSDSSDEDVPDVEQWLLGSVDENAQHRALWQRLEGRGDAANLIALIGRLTQSAPYRTTQTRAGFAERVWRVLEAADQSDDNRLLYNGIAEEALVQPQTGFQTCHDGAWLVFNQIEIQMFIEQSLSQVPTELRGQSLYRLTRRLYRLHELDAVAREQAGGRDEAEVRLAYRLRWATELDLPLPPSNMLYQVHASIRPGELDAALARVQQGEQGEPFMRYAAERDFWVEYLREVYSERFEALKEDYLARVVALPDRFPGQAIDELGEEFAALKREYEAQELNLIRDLTYRLGLDQG